MEYFSFANARYATADKAFIDIDLVLAEGAAPIPYTASASDPVSADLFAAVKKAGGVAPYQAPVASLPDQARAALAAGVTVQSTATPALNGIYALDADSRANLTSLYTMIQKAGGAFPGGLTALPYPDASGAVKTFETVADFLNFEDAVSNYVLQLMLIITTGTGTLPASTVAIP